MKETNCSPDLTLGSDRGAGGTLPGQNLCSHPIHADLPFF